MSEPHFLTRERRRVEAALAGIRGSALAELPEPLRGAVDYSLAGPGKRLRPSLCLAAYRAAAGVVEPPDAVYELACVPEIVHTYSLVHDDLPCMDDDDLRRGRPTVHRVFGDRLAILAGATLLPLAIQVLERSATAMRLPPGQSARLTVELTRAAGAAGMVGGQLLDLLGEEREVGGGELENIHRLKTGALMTASLRIGAIAGGAEEPLLAALTAYGCALGLAFQIADDVLDEEGSADEMGKTAGRDRELKKASYAAVYGLSGARSRARDLVEEAKSALGRSRSPELVELAEYVIERRR